MSEYEELAPRYKAAILDWMKTKNPFWALLGLALVDVKKGWAKVRLPIEEKLTNAIFKNDGGGLCLKS